MIEQPHSAAPRFIEPFTEPLWKLPFDGSRIYHGALSDGLSDGVATYFIVSTGDHICRLAIAHESSEAPRLATLMSFDTTSVFLPHLDVGFGKAFIQHKKGVARLGYSWNREIGDVDASTSSLQTSVVLPDYPTKYLDTRLAVFDEETGRIVQEAGVIIIVDTALYL